MTNLPSGRRGRAGSRLVYALASLFLVLPLAGCNIGITMPGFGAMSVSAGDGTRDEEAEPLDPPNPDESHGGGEDERS